MQSDELYDKLCRLLTDYETRESSVCYQAHYNKLIFHFSCKIKEVLA